VTNAVCPLAKAGKAAAMESVAMILFTWTWMEDIAGAKRFFSQYGMRQQ